MFQYNACCERMAYPLKTRCKNEVQTENVENLWPKEQTVSVSTNTKHKWHEHFNFLKHCASHKQAHWLHCGAQAHTELYAATFVGDTQGYEQILLRDAVGSMPHETAQRTHPFRTWGRRSCEFFPLLFKLCREVATSCSFFQSGYHIFPNLLVWCEIGMAQGSWRKVCYVCFRWNHSKPNIAIEGNFQLKRHLHDALDNNSLGNSAITAKRTLSLSP